jgi:beta-phosphoglucomutase-like phosphatase (HAD superfamily)
MEIFDQDTIQCFVLDWGATLSFDPYFQIAPKDFPQWHDVVENLIKDGKLDMWMEGQISWKDFAEMIVERTGLNEQIVSDHLKKGVRGLSMNKAVSNFTLAQRKAGKATVLVTGNIDLFTEIVVPDLDLYRMFDAIVNSADHCESKKEILWPIAFGFLDTPITFDQCLLIEDNARNVELFRKLGGMAYQYTDDTSFSKWLLNVGFAK